jgi:hypothetical protein
MMETRNDPPERQRTLDEVVQMWIADEPLWNEYFHGTPPPMPLEVLGRFVLLEYNGEAVRQGRPIVPIGKIDRLCMESLRAAMAEKHGKEPA